MGGGRFNPPPAPSTPREAPWTEIEILHSDLQDLIKSLKGLASAAPGVPSQIIERLPAEPSAPVAPIVNVSTPEISIPKVHERIFTATGGNANAIMVKSANWETNMWQGWEVEIVEGSGAGQFRRVIANTRDTITPRKNFDVDPDNTTVFVIRPRYPMDNPNSFKTLTKTVASTATPEQLTSEVAALVVPNGWPILLLAEPDNTGNVYFSYESAAALVPATRFGYLEAGKSIALPLTRTDLLWLAVGSDGDGVTAYVPQWATDA